MDTTRTLALTIAGRSVPTLRRSGAEMDARVAGGLVTGAGVPGALSPHEEYPGAVADAIRAAA